MEKNYKNRFSIWTATYNREPLLNRLYESIENQTFRDFEWIIVDDGSTDNTEEICREFIKKSNLKIRYVKKNNGGKHTAWIVATNMFEGKYIVTIDSDDMLTPNALEIFNKHWTNLENDSNYDLFWEVKGLCQDSNGNIIGSNKPLPASIFDSNHIEFVFKLRYKYEMHGCRKVNILKNEAKVPDEFQYKLKCSNYNEGLRWIEAGKKFQTRYVDEIVRTYMFDAPDTLSLKKNFGSNISEKRTHNTLIAAKYNIENNRQIWIKYNFWGHLKNLLIFSYMSLRIGANPMSNLKSPSIFDQFILISSYIPLLILLKILR